MQEAKPVKVNTEKVSLALQTQGTTLKPGMAIATILGTVEVKSRFEELLGKKAAGFISSILSVVRAAPDLEQDPRGVIAAAGIAASLDLPINPSLGFAYIIPYKHQGRPQAQFQMGYKGYIQLAMRSGQYKTMNVATVFEGQLIKSNPFTGLMDFDADKKESDKIVGYVAYEQFLNGFEKYYYMTAEQVKAHGLRYSPSFRNGRGLWTDNFEVMALKTPLKLMLSKWGILSIEMQQAIKYDQAVIDAKGEPQYLDGNDPNETKPQIPEYTQSHKILSVNHAGEGKEWSVKYGTDEGVGSALTEDKSIADFAQTCLDKGYEVEVSTRTVADVTWIEELRRKNG